MRKVRIGKILLVDGGEWSSTQGYGKLVYVTHNGDGYWSVRDNINSEPKAGSLDWIKATNVQPFIDAVRKETSDAKAINEQITAAESLRVEKELERINAEIQRAKNEQERIIKENARVNNESIRVQSETERVNAELQRKTDEDKRKQDFTSFMTTSANTFAEKENERKQTFETNEAGRVNSETERQMRFEQKITECQSATDLANTKALEAQNAANAATAATASCNEATQNAQTAAENAFTVAEAIQNSFVQNEAARQETFNESQRSRTNAFELAESARQQAFVNSETTRQQTFDSKEAERDAAIEEVTTFGSRLETVELKAADNAEAIERLNELFGEGVEGYVRVSGTSDPKFNYRSYKHPVGQTTVFDVFKPCLVGNNYTGRIGELLHVLNPWTLGTEPMTADGKSCKIDGTEGEVMVCNVREFYQLNRNVTIGEVTYEVFLCSYDPFEWHGFPAERIEPMGISPSYTVAHTDDDSVTRMHSCYNPAWNGSYSAQQGMVGAFVPSVAEDGTITETYDELASWFGGAGGLSTTGLALYTGEQYAMNNNEDTAATIPYFNRTAYAEETWVGAMVAEGGTWDAHNSSKMGSGFCSNDGATSAARWTEEDSLACNGFRYLKSDGVTWGYYSLSSNANFGYGASGDNLYKACMINSWRSPWRCLEQQRVIAYAIANNVAELTWFVFEGCRYKWRHVDGFAGPSEGAMTCVLWKYFASKLVANCVEPGTSNDVSGNRCEFIICSALYRGIVTDVSPSWWTSGLIFTEDENGTYEAYMQRDQAKLIKSENGDKAVGEKFNFEVDYNHVLSISYGEGYRKTINNGAMMLPAKNTDKSGASLHTYVGAYNWFTGGKAAAGKKSVRGFRRGYDAYSALLSPLYVGATYAPSVAYSVFAFGTCVRLRNVSPANS